MGFWDIIFSNKFSLWDKISGLIMAVGIIAFCLGFTFLALLLFGNWR